MLYFVNLLLDYMFHIKSICVLQHVQQLDLLRVVLGKRCRFGLSAVFSFL